MRQHHGLHPTGQRCPGLSSSGPMMVATSLYPASPHMCILRPRGFPLHLVPPLVGDKNHKADRVMEALTLAALSITLCPNNSPGVSSSHHLSFRASFSHFQPDEPHERQHLGFAWWGFPAPRAAGSTQRVPSPGSAPCRSDPAAAGGAEPRPRTPLQAASLWCGAGPTAPRLPPCHGGAGLRWYGQGLGTACGGGFGSREGPQGFSEARSKSAKWGCGIALVMPPVTGKTAMTRVGSGGCWRLAGGQPRAMGHPGQISPADTGSHQSSIEGCRSPRSGLLVTSLRPWTKPSQETPQAPPRALSDAAPFSLQREWMCRMASCSRASPGWTDRGTSWSPRKPSLPRPLRPPPWPPRS